MRRPHDKIKVSRNSTLISYKTLAGRAQQFKPYPGFTVALVLFVGENELLTTAQLKKQLSA